MTFSQANKWATTVGYASLNLGSAIGPNPFVWVEHCAAFYALYPIGAVLTPTAFDAFLQGRGVLVVPPVGTDKKDDAWIGHRTRRNEARSRMNAASLNLFLMDQVGHTPCFRIDADDDGDYTVVSPLDAATVNAKWDRVASVFDARIASAVRSVRAIPVQSMTPEAKDMFIDYIEAVTEDKRHILSVIQRGEERAQRLKSQYEVLALPSPDGSSDDSAQS